MAHLEWWAKSGEDQATPEPNSSGVWKLFGETLSRVTGGVEVDYKVIWWGPW